MSLSTNFLSQLQNTEFQGNLVLSIDGTYFSQYQPDSGLVIDSDKLGLVDTAKINGVALDIRRANTPIATIGFKLLDKNAVVSSFMGASDTQLQNAEVKLYFGFITGSFDFSDYALLGVTRINSIAKTSNGFSFSSKEVTDLMQRALLNVGSVLDSGILAVDSTLTLDDASSFPTTGRINVGTEFMQYSGKSGNQLTGLARGDLTSTAKDHDSGEAVYLVTKKDAQSMDLILDILLNDLAIDSSLINQTSFTDLRDDEFFGEDNYILYIYNVSNALKWLEARILEATNTRLFSVNGVITIGLLDQVPKFEDLPEINEDHTTKVPSWKLSSDKLINKVIVRWNWNEGTQKFTNTSVYTDDDSIAIYEERTPMEMNLYGVFSSSIVSNRAGRVLSRFSTPKAQVTCKTLFNRLSVNIADNVRLTHRYLPQEGGSLGFSDTLEVMSRSVSGLHSGATITFGLEFSSYSGIRIGLISASPKLTLPVIDQKTFTVPDGTCYGLGYRLILFDNVNNEYFSDPVNEVVNIEGNVLTMKDEFTTILGPNVSLHFSDYDSASGDQRAKYAYVAPNTGVFTIDGSKAYQIIF